MAIYLENLLDENTECEYKEKESEGLYKTVSAFSNTNGGCIIVGVNDDKNIVGFNFDNKSLEAIINKINDTMGVQPDFETIEDGGIKLLKITVSKSTNVIPYKGIYYKRVGNTTREMPREELKQLFTRDIYWDGLENDCSIEDIDEKTVQKFLKLAVAKGRLPEDSLNENVENLFKRLELITTNGKLTNGAIMLFGKNPQKQFINTTVRIGLFKGLDDTLIIGDKDIDGNLFNQVTEAETAIKSFINVRYDIKGFQREDIWDYPLVALRETMLNAIIHRDYHDFSSPIFVKIYDDRIWFYNSGNLYGVTMEQLRTAHPSKSRNPLIMKIFHLSGLVERFGSGILRMENSCKAMGIPVPNLKEEGNGFTVTYHKEYKDINERQKRAIKYVVENGMITNSIYQVVTGATRETSKRDLKKLVDKNIFLSSMENKSTKYTLKI